MKCHYPKRVNGLYGGVFSQNNMKTKSTLLKSLAALLMLLTIISCQKKKSSYVISLDDSLKQAIIHYVSENDINLKSTVIITDWVANPYRTDVYILNSSQQFINDPSQIPTYYSIISDSIVVFIYSGVERSISRDTQELSNEIRYLLIEKNIKLKPDNGYLTHTQTWLYTVCEGNGELIKEPAVSDPFYIPCRDVFLRTH